MPRGFGPLDIYTVMDCIILTKAMQRDVFATRPKLERLFHATHARDTVERLWDFYEFPRD